MRALVLHAPGKWGWEDIQEPDGEGVLVRVQQVGICGTDYQAIRGCQPFFTYPRRLGHEISVQVLESAGDLVHGMYCAVNPYMFCADCQACKRGDTNCCYELRVLGIHQDGAFTRLMRLPSFSLHPSASLPPTVLALVEPLVVGYHAVKRARISAQDQVLVVGQGPIGLACALMAKAMGADLAVMDIREDRRQSGLRLTERALAPGKNPEIVVREAFDGDLPVTVIEATGNRAAVHQSYQLVASGGTLVFVGLYVGNFEFDDPDFHRRELTLRASRNGTHDDFCAVMSLLENGTVDPSWFITDQISFNEVPDRIGSLDGARGCIKAMVDMNAAC